MSIHFGARTAATVAVSALTLVGLASAASAETLPPVIGLGAAQVLTLPAGDGVRDTTAVTVTADQPTTVTAYVRAVGDTEPVLSLDPVVIADPLTPGALTVPVEPLVAGEYEIVATPETGEAAVTALTVGSGEPMNVALSLSSSTIYTWSGASPRATTATVSATDETGLTVPFTGKVIATVGGVTATNAISATGTSKVSTSISASRLAAGTGSVVAKVSGPSSTLYASPSRSLAVKLTTVAGVQITKSIPTVYPYADGYRDSVKISVTPTTNRAGTFPATGKVRISYGGKTVREWSLTSTKKWSTTWYGKNNNKIVPGKYTITVSIKGPEGTVKRSTAYLNVSGKKLVTATLTKTYSADYVMDAYEPYDYYYDGYCEAGWYFTGDVYCRGYDAYDYDDISLVAVGTIPVPADVKNAQKFGGASVKVYANWYEVNGFAAWSYDRTAGGTRKIGEAFEGVRTLGALALPATSSTIYVGLGLGEYSRVDVTTFKTVYTFKKLV